MEKPCSNRKEKEVMTKCPLKFEKLHLNDAYTIRHQAVSDSEITHDLFHCFYARAAMGLLMSVVYGDGRD